MGLDLFYSDQLRAPALSSGGSRQHSSEGDVGHSLLGGPEVTQMLSKEMVDKEEEVSWEPREESIQN